MRKTFKERAKVKINQPFNNKDDFRAWLYLKITQEFETIAIDN